MNESSRFDLYRNVLGANMKSHVLGVAVVTLLSLCASGTALAQLSGEPYIHDPSTVAYDNGKYYTFGTGSGGLISDDGGWTWHSGAVRTGGGVAPDIIRSEEHTSELHSL